MREKSPIDLTSLKIKFFVLFIILTLGTYFVVTHFQYKNNNKILMNTTETYQRAYYSVYQQHKELSDVIASGLIKFTSIKKKLKQLNDCTMDQREQFRQELFDNILDRFKTLKSKHVNNIVFVDQRDIVFLRVRYPDRYDSKVSSLRHSIEYASKNHKSIDTYETCDNGAAFRFAYPIMDGDNYLGIIDISFGEEAIVANIMQQYFVLSNFFISQKYFKKEFIANPSADFVASHFDGYYFDQNVLNELMHFSKSNISQLKPNDKALEEILQKAQLNFPTSYYDDHIQMIYTVIPIINKITYEKQAFLAIRSDGQVIAKSNEFHNVILLLLITMHILMSLLLYFQIAKRYTDKLVMQEAYQKEKQFLEQAKMAQMGEMLGNIAHQWRQPLSVISTSASGLRLKKEFGQLDDQFLDDMVEKIMGSTQYLSETIDTFRNFILEEKTFKEVIVQNLLDEAINIVSASMYNHSIKIEKLYKDQDPIIVNLVAVDLSQVLINLLNNSREALVENRQDNRWVKVDLEQKDIFVRIIIEDNAGGIPTEILSKIFDPYFTTKHKSQGTGLGLYMCKEIIEKQHEGIIEVLNTDNGAKFIITLPKIASNIEITE